MLVRLILVFIISLIYLNSYGIYFGKDESISDVPWQLSLRMNDTKEHFCGAVLISSKFILTAKHCLNDFVPRSLKNEAFSVYGGSSDLNHQFKLPRVKRFFIHPLSIGAQSKFAFDMGVIELVSDVSFSKNLQSIALDNGSILDPSSHSNQYGLNVLISGWGDGNHKNSNILQSGFVEIADGKQSRLPSKYQEDDEVFLEDATVKVGRGDSGGPAVIYDNYNDHYVLIGITSFTNTKIYSGESFYSKVSSYDEWIERILNGKIGEDMVLVDESHVHTMGQDFY